MAHVIYSRRYNIGLLGLERLHPFDSHKYGRAFAALKRHFGKRLDQMTLRPSGPVSDEDLLSVHSNDYLSRLGDSRFVAAVLELPPLAYLPGWLIDRAVLRPMRWATQGTIVAIRESLQTGFAFNLGGGFHHAKPNGGEGFCVYSDIGIGVSCIRQEALLPEGSRIAYIDLDAHQGNGVCHVFREDRRVFVFDMYNSEIYPHADREAKERVDCDVPLRCGCGDDEYLGLLGRHLPGFLDSISKNQPIGLAIYNAGTDIVAGDPLGQLNLSPAAIVQRDQFVLSALRNRAIPTVMLPSGGYTDQSYRLIADSLIRQLEPDC